MKLSMKNPILVPIILEGLIVGKDGKMADSVPDYSLLRDRQAFGNVIENGYFTTRPMDAGVHLHWTVPDVLLMGEQQEDGSLVFPQLPNRWLIFRFGHGENSVEPCCWMIESDYVTNQATEREWKKTTLPTFCLRNGQWEGAGQKGELFGYVGEAWEYGKEAPHKDGYYLEHFTAVESGDPAFAAYYPGCSSMLGFCDRLTDKDNHQVLTYLVAGYYADPDKDPFAGKTPKQLLQMGIELKEKNVVPDGMLCHGMLSKVVWNGANVCYENGVPEEEMEVYVGDTSAEALAALVQEEMPDVTGMERMVRILQYDLLQRLDDHADEDALIRVEELLHEKKFRPEAGGISWNVRKQDEDDVVELTQQELDCLREQNRREEQIEQDERMLTSLVQEAYCMAWKYINVCHDPFLNTVADAKDAVSADEYRKQAEHLLSQAEKLSEQLVKEKKDCQDFCDKQTEYFKQKNLELYSEQRRKYYVANPPALLIVGEGVKRSFKQGYQKAENGMLPCRMRPIREICVRDDTQVLQISGIKLAQMIGIQSLQLPEPVQGLVEECLLLDTDNTGLLASLIYGEMANRAQLALVEKAQKEALVGEGAPLSAANRSYQPVWNPLFLDWEVEITPAGISEQHDTAMEEFVLGEIDLETERELSWEKEAVTIQGSCMVLPHAVENMGYMVEQLIKDCGEEEKYADLKAAATRLKNRDILSQQMDGFSDVLVMLENKHCFPVMMEPGNAKFNRLAKRLNARLSPDFNAKSPRIEKTKAHFQPLRAGLMRITKLRMIGSFGQVKEIRLKPEQIHIAEDLRCQEMHAALLRPRLPQACCVDLKWLEPDGRKPIIEQWEDPIIGYLIPNFLDNNIQIYNPKGILLGMVQVVSDGVKWMPLPWNMTAPEDWAAGELRNFVLAVLKEPARAAKLLACMDQGFNVMAGNRDLRAMCFGNVMALVRAELSVEMSGSPCTVQGWETDRDSLGYEEESFAVGIGDSRKQQDGVMGFFDSGQEGIDYETFYFCRGYMADNYIVAHNTINLSLMDHEREIVLMMDPYKEVTIRTGFLPAWSRKLPIQSSRKNIEQIEGMLRMMPILENPEDFAFLTPGGEEGWSFLYAQGQTTKVIADLKEVVDGIDERSITVMEGFLTAGKGRKE